ncbi:NADH dehydrogenase subunit K [Candidatus Gastranaerophilus sp. (ex Termes propinquus)]|nr:NADH dehydrogenase subunit K [Candidatus Gastranaerophilus sp. (ex Termes propinquus)]
MVVGVMNYLVLAFVLFSLGFLAVISSRNLIKTFTGTLFMLSAACLNFSAINAYCVHTNCSGQIFSIFISIFAIVQTVAAVAIFAASFRKIGNLDTEHYKNLKEEA